MKLDLLDKLVILLVLWLVLGGKLPSIVGPAKVDAVVYTWEKDETGSVPSHVMSALDKLNRQGIEASNDEVGSDDNTNQVPEQYEVSRPAAIAAGLPSLVVLSGGKVLRTVKAPATEAAVMEAAK